MSFENIEIEIKIEVSRNNYLRLKEKINAISTKKNMVEQKDIYFYSLNQKGYFNNEKYPYKWLRIRKTENITILTFKHHFPEGKKEHNYCNEYETIIENPNTMEMILKELGFDEKIVVKKERENYIYKDIKISFDKVEGLGFFVEFEALEKNIKSDLIEFINLFNVEYEIIDYGYPYLIKNKC